MRLHIVEEYELAYRKGWDKLYFAIDIHDTVLKADYKPGSVGGDFIGAAKAALQCMTQRKDICLIAFTCSYNHREMLDWFREQGINFEYVNENPECGNTKYGDFTQKFFFNVLLDNRAGFEIGDWVDVLVQLRTVDELTKTRWKDAPWL